MDYYRKRPQDDLPYEQQMKHIIEHYRWLLDQNEKLAMYAKKLEHRIELLKDNITKKGEVNLRQGEANVQLNRENKRLKAHISWLTGKLNALSDNDIKEDESLREG